MKYKWLIWVSLLFVDSSCNKQQKNNQFEGVDSSLTKIEMSNIGYSRIDFTTLIKDTSFVQLETTSESLIGGISKVVEFMDKYYVLDGVYEKLLIFDMEGKYLGSVGKRGNGPGEFIDLTDFSVNKGDNRIILLSVNKKSLLFFDLRGNYIEEIRLPFQSWAICSMNNDVTAHYMCYYDDENFNLRLVGNKGSGTGLFEFPIESDPMNVLSISGGIRNNSLGLLYGDAGSNIIHQVDAHGGTYPKYEIVFSNNFWPEEKRYLTKEFFQRISQGATNFLTSFYQENENALVFTYGSERTKPSDPAANWKNAYFLIDKGELFDFRNLNESFLVNTISEPLGLTEDNRFISSISCDEVYELKENQPDISSDNVEEIFTGKKIEENPVLFIYDFK